MDIAVLDYNTGNVFIYRNIKGDVESFLEEKGFNFDEIYFLVSDNINIYEYNN